MEAILILLSSVNELNADDDEYSEEQLVEGVIELRTDGCQRSFRGLREKPTRREDKRRGLSLDRPDFARHVQATMQFGEGIELHGSSFSLFLFSLSFLSFLVFGIFLGLFFSRGTCT